MAKKRSVKSKGKNLGNTRIARPKSFPSERDFMIDDAKRILTRADAIRKDKVLMRDVKKRLKQEAKAINTMIEKL